MLHLLDSPPRAEDNLALDSAWFQSVEAGAGADALHLWESPVPVVVLGRSNTLLEVKSEACAADGVAVLRRETGGGAVLLGPGCICFSLLLSFDRHPPLRDVRLSYSRILGCVIDALAVPGLAIRGLSDLALGERKVSGNAQRRGARALLHHGTLLHAFDARLVGKYLLEPGRQPDYRSARHHADFLGNLPLSAAETGARLQKLLFFSTKRPERL
jgi:lipoate-protein ligase A